MSVGVAVRISVQEFNESRTRVAVCDACHTVVSVSAAASGWSAGHLMRMQSKHVRVCVIPPVSLWDEDFGDVMLRADLAFSKRAAFRALFEKNEWLRDELDWVFVCGRTDEDGYWSVEVKRPLYSKYREMVDGLKIGYFRRYADAEESDHIGVGWKECPQQTLGATPYWCLVF